MDADLPMILAEATVAASAALLLVLALRRPVRAVLGATAAYALWLCVPAALLAVSLPRSADAPSALPVAWQIMPAVQVTTATAPQQAPDWPAWLLAAWLAGALASATLLAWQQQRFRRGLGRLQRRGDGLYQSVTATVGLPAVSGVIRPQIVLPADFEQRYSSQEQALVLQHERVHVRRGDLLANALAALLRCMFWFNPLLHVALRRFRLDQELACDEWVIARNPRARRQYGEAMLKTQFDELPLPLGCHWQARHPIKERIDMLRRPTPSPMQWMAATFLALGLSASAGYAAWAAQPGTGQPVGAIAAATQDGLFLLARQNSYDGVMGPGVLNQWVKAGEPAISTVGDGPAQWKNTAIVEAGAQAGTAVVRMRIEHGVPGATVAEPVLLVRFGETAAVEQADSSGKVAYRTQLMVLPLSGSREATEQRMRDLLAEAVQSTSPVQSSNLPAPSYPAEAARNGIDGTVMLMVTVAADGSVSDVRIEHSEPAGVFDAASLAAVREWKFRPAQKDGIPVAGQVRVPITFSTAPSPGASPVAMSDFEEYQWMRIPLDSVAESVCDIVRTDEADDTRIFCGVRKAVVAR